MFLGLVFGSIKIISFLSPLFLKNLINSNILYGQFEYSLSLGQILASLICMGFSSTYAYFIVIQNKNALKPIFHLHFLIFISLCFVTAILYPKILDNLYFGAFVIAILLADQIFMSATLKLAERNNSSVLIDSLIYFNLAIILVLTKIEVINFNNKIWHQSILLLLIIIGVVYHLRNLDGIKNLKFKYFKELYGYAGLILISTPLLYMINSGTRIYIEWLLDFDKVGTYSYFFRIASFSLIFYRITTILLYKKIFTSEIKILDSYFQRLSIFLLSLNIVTYLFLKYGYSYLNFLPSLDLNENIILLCLFQINFWVNTALLESIIQRENKVKHFILLLLTVNILMIGSYYFMKYYEILTISKIISWNVAAIFLVFLGQIYILKRTAFFKKLLIIHSITGIGFLFFLIL